MSSRARCTSPPGSTTRKTGSSGTSSPAHSTGCPHPSARPAGPARPAPGFRRPLARSSGTWAKPLRTGCRQDGVNEELVEPFPLFPVRKVRRVLEQHPFLRRCDEAGEVALRHLDRRHLIITALGEEDRNLDLPNGLDQIH